MYRPSYSINENIDLAAQLIQDYPLGILISNEAGLVETNYLPFLVQQVDSALVLTTHMARSNPQWKMLGSEVLVSFQGPNRYISPTMYHGKNNVPTWNYAVVQIQGQPEIITDKKGINDILHASIDFFEAENQTDWNYDLPAAMQERLESAIVGIKIKASSVAKFKLSQNRTDEDYEAVLDFLRDSAKPSDQELLQWMVRSQTNDIKKSFIETKDS